MRYRHLIQSLRLPSFRIVVVVFYLLIQWTCSLHAKDISDSDDRRFSHREFQGNIFTWYNGIDTDYVLDPIADSMIYILLTYPVRIVMVNEDSVHVTKLSDYERNGYLVKDYFSEVLRMEVPALMDSIEALCFRHVVINDQGKIIFYEVKWYREPGYLDIENKYFSDKIASIMEQSGPWLNSDNAGKHSLAYIPSGFTIYTKKGIIVTDEEQ